MGDFGKLIFVYGTLMEGFGNNGLLARSEFVTEAVTQPVFTMISLGGFPGVLAGGDTAIKGEVFLVTSIETLNNLDRLEGHPSWYCRTPITVQTPDGGELSVETYIYLNGDRDNRVVESGSWREYRHHPSRRELTSVGG